MSEHLPDSQSENTSAEDEPQSDSKSVSVSNVDFVYRPPSHAGTWIALALAIFAITLRIGVIVQSPDRLNQDVDGYLAIAETLYESGTYGYSAGNPTAFRPPLYPTLISRLLYEGRAALNIVCSLLTIAIVLATVPAVRTGWPNLTDFSPEATRTKLTGLSSASSRERRMMWATALFCVCSPLAVLYVGYSMTETLCATLLAVALVEITQLARPNPRAILFIGAPAAQRRRTWSAILLGASLGLASLTRPSCFAVAAVWLAWLAWTGRTNRSVEADAVRALDPQNDSGLVPDSSGIWASSMRLPTIAFIALLVVVSPWVIRNTAVFGRPILTTTHGGYTILLGNNEAFYDEVVNAPWGTTWTEGQQRWANQLNAQMDQVGLEDEVSRDAWQKRRAWETILNRPNDFAKAVLLRFTRFWNVVPQSDQVPKPVWLLVGAFYSIAWFLAVIGIFVSWREKIVAFAPAAFLPLAFMGVHLLYWSNARMRLPVEPAVFLFSSVGVDAIWRRLRETAGDSGAGQSAETDNDAD